MIIVTGFQFINMGAIIQSCPIEAREKIFCLLTSYEFYLLLSLLLRQKKKHFVY